MDIREKMKPCPFCGQKVDIVEIEMSRKGFERIRVNCECGADIEFKGDEYIDSNMGGIRIGKDALEKWNTREGKQ